MSESVTVRGCCYKVCVPPAEPFSDRKLVFASMAMRLWAIWALAQWNISHLHSLLDPVLMAWGSNGVVGLAVFVQLVAFVLGWFFLRDGYFNKTNTSLCHQLKHCCSPSECAGCHKDCSFVATWYWNLSIYIFLELMYSFFQDVMIWLLFNAYWEYSEEWLGRVFVQAIAIATFMVLHTLLNLEWHPLLWWIIMASVTTGVALAIGFLIGVNIGWEGAVGTGVYVFILHITARSIYHLYSLETLMVFANGNQVSIMPHQDLGWRRLWTHREDASCMMCCVGVRDYLCCIDRSPVQVAKVSPYVGRLAFTVLILAYIVDRGKTCVHHQYPHRHVHLEREALPDIHEMHLI